MFLTSMFIANVNYARDRGRKAETMLSLSKDAFNAFLRGH